MKSKTVWALAFALLETLSFIFIAKSIENKYGYIYEHYYQRTPYTNLSHINKYNKEKDNRLTLRNKLNEFGVTITKIKDGYTDRGHLVNSPQLFDKRIYYVNDDLYIIFDWNEEKVTAKSNKHDISELLFEQHEHLNKNMHSDTTNSSYRIGLRNENRDVLNDFIILPTKNDTFKLIEN